MRKSILLVSALFLSACGGLVGSQSGQGTNPLAGLFGGAQGPDPRETLTRAAIEAAPADLLLFALASQEQSSVLQLVARNGRTLTWRSAEGATVATEDGLIVATRGLGNDLMGADVAQVRDALRQGRGRAIRLHSYLDGEDKIVLRPFACEVETLRTDVIEIFDKQHPVTVLRESCRGEFQAFANVYWRDSAGVIWQARQMISPRVGAVDLQLL